VRRVAIRRQDTEKPRMAGLSQCAREDSNLHELSAHKALNLNLGVSDVSEARKIGRCVRACGRVGRIWTSVCSHDVLTARLHQSPRTGQGKHSPGVWQGAEPRPPAKRRVRCRGRDTLERSVAGAALQRSGRHSVSPGLPGG
jgi:ribosomal protein L16/L10AE